MSGRYVELINDLLRKVSFDAEAAEHVAELCPGTTFEPDRRLCADRRQGPKCTGTAWRLVWGGIDEEQLNRFELRDRVAQPSRHDLGE